MQFEDFEKQLTKVAIAFNRELSPELVMIYFEQFSGWTDKQFRSAVNRCIQDDERFPTVSMIKRRWRPREANEAAPVVAPRIVSEVRTNRTLDEKIDEMDSDEVRQLVYDWSKSNHIAKDMQKRFENQETLARDLVKDLVSPSWNDENEKTVACRTCNDRGYVEVYQAMTVRLAMAGVLSEQSVHTEIVTCSCDKQIYDPMNEDAKPMGRFKTTMLVVKEVVPRDQVLEVIDGVGSETESEAGR